MIYRLLIVTRAIDIDIIEITNHCTQHCLSYLEEDQEDKINLNLANSIMGLVYFVH